MWCQGGGRGGGARARFLLAPVLVLVLLREGIGGHRLDVVYGGVGQRELGVIGSVECKASPLPPPS